MFETTVKAVFFLVYLFTIQTNCADASSIFRENFEKSSLEFENKADEEDITNKFLKLDDEGLADESCNKLEDAQCREFYRKCVRKIDNEGKQYYRCGECLKGYVQDGENEDNCIFDHCENRGDSYCRSSGRTCANVALGGFKCKDCLDGFVRKNRSQECEEDVCDEDGISQCAAEHKLCGKKVKDGYTCGNCEDNYFENGGGICILATCENTGNYRCKSMNRECEDIKTGFQCSKCEKGFVEYEGIEKCVKECSCENGECKLNKDMEPYCSCFRGFGIWTSGYCRACECGKGVGCYWGVNINRVMNKYCECPSGNQVIDGPCIVTCKNLGNEVCGEMNRVCSDNSTEDYECGECKEGYVEDMETKKCVPATCATKGNKLCGDLNRTCNNISQTGYECGGCISGYLPVENSPRCTRDWCLSSPCENSGICKVVKDSFDCYCMHPFFGETCEQEYITTTTVQSTPSNWSPTFDENTNSTTDGEISKTEPSNITGSGTTTEVPINEKTSVGTTSVASTTTEPITTPTDTPVTTTQPTTAAGGDKIIINNVLNCGIGNSMG